MTIIVGTKDSPVHFCSTEWVKELVKAELEALTDMPASVSDVPEIKLHVDFGGMISTKIPRISIPHEDGEFIFYIHQRTGIRDLIEQALASAGKDEYVKIQSQNHLLCITTEHALHLLLQLDSDEMVGMEKDALVICRDIIESLRKDEKISLAAHHRTDVQ